MSHSFYNVHVAVSVHVDGCPCPLLYPGNGIRVWATSPDHAVELFNEALTSLIRDEIDGEIPRDRGPGSY